MFGLNGILPSFHGRTFYKRKCLPR